MLSITKTALQSTIRDSFSRNNSDSEQSKDGINDSPQKQSILREKTDLLGNTKFSETNGNSPFPTPISTPKDEDKQLNAGVESSISLQENLTGTVTNVDNTQVIIQPSSSPSNSVASLKIEHFDRELDDELTTPIAGDITSQIPPPSNTSTTLNDRNDLLLPNDANTSRKFRLPTKSNSAKTSKQKKRRSRGPSILDESLIDSPPLNGYVPAAPRRNVEFHALFRSVPEEDFLINDYGCALQKEILVQGRLYVSANHVCFNANIFGWVTNLVIAFSDIVSIEKKMTAYVIPNAILISTLHAKHFFTTFLSRDSVYDLLIALWKQIHPSLTMTSLTESEYGTSQKCSDASETSEENFISSDDEDVVDSKRTEKLHPISPRNQSRHLASNGVKKRRPTQCACLKKGQHYDNVSLDTKFIGSVEKIFNLIFTSEFLKRYLTEEDKCTDLEIGEWNTESSKWTRSQSYIKPLNNAIGPKSTKCIIEDECQHRDFDNYVTNVSTTTTPDVPSGNSFCVKNRICIMWAGANESRIIVTCSIEWSKSSWLKGTIERACIDGQQTYWKDLAQAIKKYIATHPSEFRDESVQEETVDSDEKVALKRTQTRPKDRIHPAEEIPDIQENEPITVKHHNVLDIVTNIMTSILNSLTKYITIPSTNAIILLILLMLVINNFNNWLTLRNIGCKLDSLDSRKGELFSKSHEYREYTPLFLERIENEEDDPLWQWLQERSKMYEEATKQKGASNSESTSTRDHTTSSETSPSPQIHSDDNNNSQHFGQRPVSSQSLHEQIGDIYRLIQVAEGHVKKLVDVAEFESSYYRGSEDNINRQHYSDEL
ncbi:hypothetical protein C1645_785068 [Glomus cerebriforme]|uniref:VASt domain-containing protein n=1 Tax=Glomus cerebriforme TaxID=658196 RepID=A0A397SGL3_9GLOM|nr:hypothetical protein C1645_785068 [Glomus cerebriforme]